MQIKVLGSGNMGRSLGMLWAEQGHAIYFGAKEEGKAREVAKFVGHGAQGGSIKEVARFGEVLLYTRPGGSG